MNTISARNFLDNLPVAAGVESLEIFARWSGGRIERIVSRGQASAPGFWYEQDEDEWVLLLQGGAQLAFDNGQDPVRLAPGDSLLIPAGLRHRVEWTRAEPCTIWLAVFWQPAV